MDTIMFILYYFVGITSVFYLFFRIKFNYWKSRGIPHLEPSIPFGNVKPGKSHFLDFFDEIYNKFKHESQFAGMYFFFNPAVLITDLDLCKNILIKDSNNFLDRGMYYNEKDDPLSAHLFNLEGEKWRALRAKLSPTFTSGKMKFMFPTIVQVGNEFQRTLAEITSHGDEVEIKELLARFTTDVIGTCAFGIECNSLKNPDAEFRKYGKLSFDISKESRLKRIFLQQFKSLARILGMKRTREDVTSFFMNVVKETVALREKNNIRRNDFMDLLIELKNSDTGKLSRLTMEEIAAQAFVFFLAGFETSSTTMSYCLYELSLNQDIQDRAREEILTVLKRHNGNFTYEAMMEMTYLEQIINEALRKYPPVILLQRKALEDYKVPNTNHVIEKGTLVMIPAYSMQRDPEIYPDPEKFDPDRFSLEAQKDRHSMSFLAFGDGPRNCIGLRFGRMQARVGLVSLLSNFKFSTSSRTPIPLKYSRESLVLSPEGGLWLTVEKN